MASNTSFTVKNGVTVGSTRIIAANAVWVGVPSNYPGVQGNTGPQGPQGNAGPQGPQGVAGAQGAQGDAGAAGAQGPQGAAPVGAQGAQGSPGVAGGQGVAGVQGAQGPQGVQGASGPTGAQGPQGVTGAAGTTGSGATNLSALGVNTPAGPTGVIRATSDITAFYSDRRLKKNIQPITNALEKVQYMTGVYYKPNKLAQKFGYSDNSRQVGLIAQQVNVGVPEVIDIAPFDADYYGNSISGDNYMTIKYEKLVPILIEAIKEQQKEIGILMQIVEERGK